MLDPFKIKILAFLFIVEQQNMTVLQNTSAIRLPTHYYYFSTNAVKYDCIRQHFDGVDMEHGRSILPCVIVIPLAAITFIKSVVYQVLISSAAIWKRS